MPATVLTEAAGVDDALLFVDDATGSSLISGSVFQIDEEVMRARFVTSDGLRVGVDRGFNGSTRATHVDASTIVSNGVVDGSISKADLAGGFMRVTLAVGTASATDVAVTGMVAGDELVFVGALATAAAIATLVDRTSEYAVGTAEITKAAGTNETNNQLLIIWLDLT